MGQQKIAVAETVGWVPPRAGGLFLQDGDASKGSGGPFAIDWVTGRSRNWAGDYLRNDDAPLRGSMHSQATVSCTSEIPATHWSARGAGVIRGTEKETLGSTGGAPTGSPRAPSWCLSARACVLHSRLGGRQ